MKNEITLNPYLAGIMNYLKDQKVEIFLGDMQAVAKLSDIEPQLKSIVVGTIIDAMGDCLVIECEKKNQAGHIIKGKIYLNAWQIKTICLFNNPLYSKDFFSYEHEV